MATSPLIADRGWKSALLAMSVVLFVCGCVRGPRASMGHLFDGAPSRSQSDVGQQSEPESTVSANTARAVDSVEPSEAVSVLDDSERAESRKQDATPFGPGMIVDPEEQPGKPHSERDHSGPKIWDRRMVSQAAENTVHRLKRALSSDSRATPASTDLLSGQHPLRVKVDGLFHQAERLYQAGDYQDAKILAERAVDLAEALALEYLPDEDRPDDLLQKILTAIDDRDQAPVTATTSATDELLAPPVLIPPTGDHADIPPQMPPSLFEESTPTNLSRDTVAANRPLLLPESTLSRESSGEARSELVVMEPHLSDAAPPKTDPPPMTAMGLQAPFREPRFQIGKEAAPLMAYSETRPAPPQIADVPPLPAFGANVTPRPATPISDAPVFSFVWADLWPVWMLAGVIAAFGTGLLARRVIAGH